MVVSTSRLLEGMIGALVFGFVGFILLFSIYITLSWFLRPRSIQKKKPFFERMAPRLIISVVLALGGFLLFEKNIWSAPVWIFWAFLFYYLTRNATAFAAKVNGAAVSDRLINKTSAGSSRSSASSSGSGGTSSSFKGFGGGSSGGGGSTSKW